MKALFIILQLVLLNNIAAIAQGNSTLINGKVISFEESFPIEGASIVVKGTKNYTGTQVDGSFTLSIQPVDTIIIVSYEGFTTQEIKLNGDKKDYNIVLRRLGNLDGISELYSVSQELDLQQERLKIDLPFNK